MIAKPDWRSRGDRQATEALPIRIVPPVPPVEPVAHLSEREEEIAELVSSGLSNKEIGKRLGISHWTVSTHLRRIFIKLEISRRIELCLLIRAIGR